MTTTTTEASVAPGHVTATTPYAWPWNGVLDASRTAVLVIEQTGDTVALAGVPLHNAAIVVAALAHAGGTAIRVVTRRASRGSSGAPAAAGAGGTGGIPVATAVVSQGIDGFYGGPLESLLRRSGIERLLLVGAGLETSVHSTMRTANDMGFECLLVVDACAPGDEGLVANSVSMIEMSGGIFGAVGVTARVVEAYAPTEGEPE
jgi:hypothetical protein